ncbi:MAG: prepilin-type N-terminal cleavage/methylation domain-containing protein [Coprobacillus sp.]
MNIKNLRKNKKGFTLIEIIVVVVILAVLMAVAVPSVLKYLGEADNSKYMTQANGQVTETQAELAKSYSTTSNKATWVAKATIMVAGNPKVNSVKVFKTDPVTVGKDSWTGDGEELVAGESPEIITSYEVTFEDGTKALVRINQDVIVDPK